MNARSEPDERRKNGEASILRILETAVGVIARLGYEGASMKEIAGAAGVSKSLLHYHFESKEDLLVRALSHLSEQIADAIQARAGRPGSPMDRLLATADDLYELLLSDQEKTAFLTEMYATAIHNEPVREQLEKYRKTELNLIRDSLEAAVGVHEDRFVISLDRMARVIQNIIVGVSVERAAVSDPSELASRWEDIKQFLITGLMMPMLGEDASHFGLSQES